MFVYWLQRHERRNYICLFILRLRDCRFLLMIYSTVSVMAKTKSETGFDRELYKKLHEAVVNGNTTKVQSLLETFTKDDVKDILHNRYGAHYSVPLLLIAIRNRHKNLVQLLVNHYDVRVNYTDLKPHDDTDSASIAKWTPVLECVLVRDPVILNIICKKVQDINIGYPVHWTCKRKIHGGTDLLNILLRHGAQISNRDERGFTPLIVACQYRNYDLVHFLLQYGADVNLCSLDCSTPLHHLIKGIDGYTNSIPNMNSPDESDRDHQKSAEQSVLQISKELLEHGMLQNTNERRLTPLDLACLEGSESIVEILLDNLSANDTERANCFELLVSSFCLKSGLILTHMKKMKNYLDTPHYFLNKAMMIRHSHNPPLWKHKKQDSVETVFYLLETRTLEELAAIKTNFNGLIIKLKLLFSRQRTLGVELYNEYLLPYMGKCIDFKINEQLCYKANGRRGNHVVVFLLGACRLQRKSYFT